MKKHLYIKVSRDKYELPVAVAETAGELARMLGVSEGMIRSRISNAKKGYRGKSVYRLVEWEEEDGED